MDQPAEEQPLCSEPVKRLSAAPARQPADGAGEGGDAAPRLTSRPPPGPPAGAGGEAPLAPSPRLASLDAFRGFAVLGMLLVNEKAFGPATPEQLTHAEWHEPIHFADLVFPWFVFIVGVAIPYAAASRRRAGTGRLPYHLGVLQRAAALVLMGCLINSSYARRPMFDIGVLQLIGFAYLVATLLYGLPFKLRVGAVLALLLAHWAVVKFLPAPGVGAGVFTESHNAIRHLDHTYLRRYHLDGFMSVLTASSLAAIGTMIGDLLRRGVARPARRAAAQAPTSQGPGAQPCLRTGVIAIAIGAGLVAAGLLWGFNLPLNKPVWTSSYVVFAAGCGCIALGCFYLLIDVKGWRSWAFPLIVPGMNAIFAFLVPILVKLHTLREWTWALPSGSRTTVETALQGAFFAHFGRVPGGFLYTGGYIFFWWLVLLWMYRRRLFWRV